MGKNSGRDINGLMADHLDLRHPRLVVGVASGYFDFFHVGHLRYLRAARELVDVLVVVVNTDFQASLKKGGAFVPEAERAEIVAGLACVDHVVLAVDEDRTINKTLEILRPAVFANGGDVRSEADCREAETCRRLGIRMEFGVGGFEKIRSSRDLILAATRG